MKDKTKKINLKIIQKKLSQFGLTRLTHDLRYKIRTTSYKWKKKRSRSSRPNNPALKDKIEKKSYLKKNLKKKTGDKLRWYSKVVTWHWDQDYPIKKQAQKSHKAKFIII